MSCARAWPPVLFGRLIVDEAHCMRALLLWWWLCALGLCCDVYENMLNLCEPSQPVRCTVVVEAGRAGVRFICVHGAAASSHTHIAYSNNLHNFNPAQVVFASAEHSKQHFHLFFFALGGLRAHINISRIALAFCMRANESSLYACIRAIGSIC